MRFLRLNVILIFVTLFIHQNVLAQEEAEAKMDTVVQKLVIGIKEAPPFVIEEDGHFRGLSILLWDKIALDLNLVFEYKVYEDLPSLTEAIESGEVDLSVNPITVTTQRIRTMKFSQPFFISSLGVAMKKKQNEQLMMFLKNIFSIDFFKALFIFIGLISVFGFLIWLAERGKNQEQFPNGVKGIGNGFWWSAVTMTTVGYGDKSPVTFFGRLIGFVWMFAAIIVISSLTASIASALTINTLGNNVNDIYDFRNYEIGTIKGSSSESFIALHGMRYKEYETPLETLEAVALEEIETFVYDTPIMQHFIHQGNLGDQIQILPHTLTTDYYSFSSAKDSDILQRINPTLLENLNSAFWREQLSVHLPRFD